MNPALLEILCCPETHQHLREAEPVLINEINADIRAGHVRNRAGKKVEDPLDGGLVCQDGAFIYPIRSGIPVLLTDEAISLVPIRGVL